VPKRSQPKPRIFISHSAHEEVAEAILDNLVDSLATNFDVFCDKKRLIAGEEWRDELFTAMQRAHGAVILFSADALKSGWVRTESSVLAWRRTLVQSKSFPIIPVLLKPVTRADLEGKEFSPMRLSTLQLVRSNNSAQINKQVKQGLQQLLKLAPPATPMENLAQTVATLLENIKEGVLLNAATAMDVDVSEWNDSKEYPLLLANEMLKGGLASARLAIRKIDEILGPDKTSTLIEMIAPVWVNQHAASVIPQIATREAEVIRSLWVNGGDKYPEFTARHFVRRACCRAPNFCWPVLPIAAPGSGEHDVAYYKYKILASIKSKVFRIDDDDEAVVKALLDQRETDKEPIFVVFFPPGPEPELITALGKEFPTLTFFILTGNQVPGTLPVGVEYLEPMLQAGEEAKAYIHYKTATSYIILAGPA
jgi:hypothetical protein